MSREQKIMFLNDLAKGKKDLRKLKVPIHWFALELFTHPSRPDVYIWPTPCYREIKKEAMEEWANTAGFKFKAMELKPNTPEWDKVEISRNRCQRHS